MKISARIKEKIARTIGDFFTTKEILNVFTDLNIPMDTGSSSKWSMTLDAFHKAKDVDEIFSVIEEFCHPLCFYVPGRREEFIDSLNQILTYDGFQIQFTDRTAQVIASSGEKISKNKKVTVEKQTEISTPKTITDDEIPVIDLDSEDVWEDATPTKAKTESAKFLDEQMIKSKKSQVKELANSHQALIDIVEFFCGNPKKPTKQLNDAYLFLVRKIQDIVDKLDLKYYDLSLYRPFKNDLYAAEIEWNGDGTVLDMRLTPKLSWDAIRPQLYNAHSNIEKIRNISEETEQMTDDEKRLEEITELISKMRTRKITKNTPKDKPFPIEITNFLPLQFSGETSSQKTQPKLPNKLPAGTQWKNITIRFVDEDSVAILVQGKEHIVSYQEMGFEGKGGKPSVLWGFLKVLAIYNGEIASTDQVAKDSYKKQKQSLSEKLKSYFSLDTDPFHPFQDGKSYRVKFTLIPLKNGFSFEKKRVDTLLEKPEKEDPYADLDEVMNEYAPVITQTEIHSPTER